MYAADIESYHIAQTHNLRTKEVFVTLLENSRCSNWKSQPPPPTITIYSYITQNINKNMFVLINVSLHRLFSRYKGFLKDCPNGLLTEQVMFKFSSLFRSWGFVSLCLFDVFVFFFSWSIYLFAWECVGSVEKSGGGVFARSGGTANQSVLSKF